jgi:protein required for attachment to host cells
LVIENAGDGALPKLEVRDTMEQTNPAAHMQGSDKPGRAFSSGGTRRGAVEQTDFHEQAETRFLQAFAERLHHAVSERGIGDLLLIAPARALGVLRPALSPAVTRIVTGELDSDYVKLSLHGIERQLKRKEARTGASWRTGRQRPSSSGLRFVMARRRRAKGRMPSLFFVVAPARVNSRTMGR